MESLADQQATTPVVQNRTLSTVQVIEVKNRRDFNRFLKLPWKIYRDDPAWVPPLLLDIKEFLSPKHPFRDHGTAVKFLAVDGDDNPVGRILVSDDPRYNEENETNLGCFGLFESIDDQAVADALFEAAADWLRSRGRDFVMGPIEYSTNYSCGLLIEGFDTPPRILMPHHPPYYLKLYEAWNLRKNKDLYAWWFDDRLQSIARLQRLADRIERRGKIKLRSFNKRDFQNEVDRIHQIYDRSRKDWWWACVTLTRDEIEHFAKQLYTIGVLEHVLFAEVEGEPVGFAITMPDVNEAIRPLNGRLMKFGLPINLVRFFYRLKRVKTARMMLLCVDDQYRRRGIAEILILRTLDYGMNTIGYDAAELGWTDESNDKVNKIIEQVGGQRYKKYRVFEREL